MWSVRDAQCAVARACTRIGTHIHTHFPLGLSSRMMYHGRGLRATHALRGLQQFRVRLALVSTYSNLQHLLQLVSIACIHYGASRSSPSRTERLGTTHTKRPDGTRSHEGIESTRCWAMVLPPHIQLVDCAEGPPNPAELKRICLSGSSSEKGLSKTGTNRPGTSTAANPHNS